MPKRDDADDDAVERTGGGQAVHRLVESAVAAGDEERLAPVRDRHRGGALGVAVAGRHGDVDVVEVPRSAC